MASHALDPNGLAQSIAGLPRTLLILNLWCSEILHFQQITWDKLDSGYRQTVSSLVTWFCAHFGSLEMLNLKAELSLWASSSIRTCSPSWLKCPSSEISFILVVNWWQISSCNMSPSLGTANWNEHIWDGEAACSIIFWDIIDDNWVGNLQTKMQLSPPTCNIIFSILERKSVEKRKQLSKWYASKIPFRINSKELWLKYQQIRSVYQLILVCVITVKISATT